MAGKLLTVISSYAPYHDHLIERAAASVAAQTIPTDYIPIRDNDMRGPSWGRNEGVRLAKTPFVTWLDADDTLEEDYAEKMIGSYKPGHYVYCDFWMGKSLVRMCECTDLWKSFNEKTGEGCEPHNVVTSLMHKSVFEQVGGFQEGIFRLEDTHFWLKAMSRGVYGIRCPYPLMTYTADGQRSKEAQKDPRWLKSLLAVYKEFNLMATQCCGGVPAVIEPTGKQPGDILVMCTWGGNRSHTGRITNRVYPRNGNNMLAWVDPRDAAARPQEYRIVQAIAPEPPEPETPPAPAPLPPDIDLSSATRAELINELESRGFTLSDVTGTGADGAILKADLVGFLTVHA